jgi:hypothetical protein
MYQKSDGTCACGFFLENGLSWEQAVNQCHALGARLPEIYSAEDNKQIFNLKVNLYQYCFESLRNCFVGYFNSFGRF